MQEGKVAFCHLRGELNVPMDTAQVVKEAFLLLPSTGPDDEVVIHVMGPAEGLVVSPTKWHAFSQNPPCRS